MVTYHLKEIHGGLTHDGQTVDEMDMETMLNFVLSVKIIAAAEGPLTEQESEEMIGMMRAFGLPDEGLAALDAFDPVGKELADFLPRNHPTMIRHFIYDAIKIGHIHGYNEPERRAVRQAAELGGVDESVVIAIEGLIEIEQSVRAARLAILREHAEVPHL